MNSGRYNVQGVAVSAVTLEQVRDLVLGVRHGNPRGYICHCTVHGVAEARADPSFRRILNESWLTVPDGMPLVWLGGAGVGRVYGPDLMLAVCDAGRAAGLRHYFYGGAAGVADELCRRLEGRFHGLAIAGRATPPFRPATPGEIEDLRAELGRVRADVVWVGLGTPKQERFMAAHWRALGAGVLIGVGAAFDFHAGRVRQAPPWMQRSGLEWLHRVAVEPRRLGPRYLRTNPLFVARLLAQKTGVRKYPIVTD